MRTLWKALLALFLTLRGLINEARFPKQLGPREKGVCWPNLFFALPVVTMTAAAALRPEYPPDGLDQWLKLKPTTSAIVW